MTDNNATIESIMTTRAIRRFTNQPVSDAEIETCLRAAQQAPSGGNVQPQQYVVLTDSVMKTKIAGWYRLAFDRYEKSLPEPTAFKDEAQAASWARTRDASRFLADHLEDVPVIVLFLQPIIPWGSVDEQGAMDIGRLDASVYPAVQNFCLAARSLGLGTALTTVIRIHADEVLDALGVPRRDNGAVRYEIAALVPVGHPVGNFGVAPRKPAGVVTHWNAWGVKRR
ncbi:MAG TPA: nitroreductase family protein [Ilumatobacteraceae bacterium]|nr:nitroreductase family protein [Ilumatobacteraceae bacterium]